eukprot:1772562-Amphidinium_carterae.1
MDIDAAEHPLHPDRKALLAQLRSLEEGHKVLKAVAPQDVQAQLTFVIDDTREALRSQAPAPARMSGLQKAIERQQAKLERLRARMLENAQGQAGLEAAMGAELAEVRR